jgi:pilus assembly protein Flp/PilA
MQLVKFVRRLLRDTGAATAIEYGLILALVCLAMMVSLRGVANANGDMWARVMNAVAAALNA